MLYFSLYHKLKKKKKKKAMPSHTSGMKTLRRGPQDILNPAIFTLKNLQIAS